MESSSSTNSSDCKALHSVTQIAQRGRWLVTYEHHHYRCSRCFGGVPSSPWASTGRGEPPASHASTPPVTPSPPEVCRMENPVLCAPTDRPLGAVIVTLSGPLSSCDEIDALKETLTTLPRDY